MVVTHNIKDIYNILKSISIPIVKNNKKIEYLNVPCSFDIETYSFKTCSQCEHKCKNNINECKYKLKVATMYVWAFAIYDNVVIGRTWDEFKELINLLSTYLDLHEDRRLIIYVHNLEYEFQFMRKYFKWKRVFALEERTPVSALCEEGIEFKCSLKLSGYRLEKVAEHLNYKGLKKLVGDLDYTIPRHSKTKLTEKEEQYLINDVLIVSKYIEEYIEKEKNIYDIPLTKTGVVRRYCRNKCFYDDDRKKGNKNHYNYNKFIQTLTFNEKEYEVIKNCFIGGFTHANPFYVKKHVHNVNSFDFTSSYPYVMVSEKFPMSKPYRLTTTIEEYIKYMKTYCCCFRIKFFNLKPLTYYENYLSVSHCKSKNVEEFNGRIVSAEECETYITNIDFKIISKMYEWDKIEIDRFLYFKKDYLPTKYVESILNLYENKTKLKDVNGFEQEYMFSKEAVNSLYGMMVTDIVRDELVYEDEWKTEPKNISDAIYKNNNSKNRFLYYPWGVFVTAYARRNLFTAILELGEDYIYSDTDSVKFINYDLHSEYFEIYNKKVEFKLQEAMEHHNLNFDLVAPKTIKGKIKMLGVWDKEPFITDFKTLGAKRYMYKSNGELKITVAGLSKSKGCKFLESKYGEKVFDYFDDGLFVPAEKTGKLTHTYIDNIREGYITDINGVTNKYHEESCIHLEPASFSMNMSELSLKYLLGIKDRVL